MGGCDSLERPLLPVATLESWSHHSEPTYEAHHTHTAEDKGHHDIMSMKTNLHLPYPSSDLARVGERES